LNNSASTKRWGIARQTPNFILGTGAAAISSAAQKSPQSKQNAGACIRKRQRDDRIDHASVDALNARVRRPAINPMPVNAANPDRSLRPQVPQAAVATSPKPGRSI
jgi:hypothetical protein